MGQNTHVKHDLAVDLSPMRQTADLKVSADVSYVYFTHAVIHVQYYATHNILYQLNQILYAPWCLLSTFNC